MKKIISMFLFLCIIGGVYQTNAFKLKVKEEVEITEAIEDDVYSAGGRIEVSSKILGDIVAAAGELYLNGEIVEDAILAGGDVTISEPIGDDLRVAGGNVTIEADVMGDVIVFSGDLRIKENVTIHGDLIMFAGNVKLEGTVLGDMRTKAGRLAITGVVKGDAHIEVDSFSSTTGSGAIEGKLNYRHNEKLAALEKLAAGEIHFEIDKKDDDTWEHKIMGVAIGYIIIKIIGTFIFASLIYFYFENIFIRSAKKLKDMPGKSALYGFLLFIGMPIVAVLLMITVIGIPFGLLTLVMYIFMIFFAKLFNVMVFTAFAHNKYNFDTPYKKLAVIFGFTLLFCLVSIVNILATCFVLGALLMQKVEMIEEARR